jgi:syndecan 1
VLEKQSKALLKLPTKKERSAIEALEAQIAAEREEARGAAARHRLTVERLRCQVKSLQVRGVCHCP